MPSDAIALFLRDSSSDRSSCLAELGLLIIVVRDRAGRIDGALVFDATSNTVRSRRIH
jgi:hypothetical protein